MELLTFPETVELLDQLKERWYMLKYISEQHSTYGDLASAARLALDELDRNVTAITALMRSSADAHVKETQLKGYLSFDGLVFPCKRKQLQRLTEETLEEARQSDYPFYVQAGYGKYWNEVPLPGSIKHLFTTYVELTKQQYPGMLGVERPDMVLSDNAVALSIYDLSDTAVVFENRASLDIFLSENSVEPSDIMCWTGIGWQC